MKQWDGMHFDTAANNGGATFIQNSRFYTDGEIQRRHALQLMNYGSVNRTISLATFGDAKGQQYVMVFTSAGNIEMVETI